MHVPTLQHVCMHKWTGIYMCLQAFSLLYLRWGNSSLSGLSEHHSTCQQAPQSHQMYHAPYEQKWPEKKMI